MMNEQMIRIITEAVVGLVALFISAYLIPWLKNKIGEDKMAMLESFVKDCVRAAEQKYTPEQWQEKRQYVGQLVADKCAKLGLGLNEAEVDAIIEGVVNYVKHNKAVVNGGD